MRAEGCPGDDHEAILRQARDREVAFDAAARVEHLGVDDRADRFVDVVGAKGLQEIAGARSLHFDLGEGCLIEERGGFAGRADVRSDGR